MSNQSQTQVQQRDSGLLSTVVTGTVNFAKRNKTLSVSYVIGMLLLLFGTGFRVSDDARAMYEATIDSIDTDEIVAAYHRYANADAAYQQTRGFFSCDNYCQGMKAKMETARLRYEDLRKLEAARVNQAKQGVGIFSEYGVQETRDNFWKSFSGGKEFAKRQSMWDMFFVGLRWGKDEELPTVILRWLLNVLMNFTIGVIIAFFSFVWKLWGIISAYQPDIVTATIFFIVALISATSFLATYLIAIYAATAGTVAVGAKMAVDHNRRLQQDPAYRRARMQSHPHYT